MLVDSAAAAVATAAAAAVAQPPASSAPTTTATAMAAGVPPPARRRRRHRGGAAMGATPHQARAAAAREGETGDTKALAKDVGVVSKVGGDAKDAVVRGQRAPAQNVCAGAGVALGGGVSTGQMGVERSIEIECNRTACHDWVRGRSVRCAGIVVALSNMLEKVLYSNIDPILPALPPAHADRTTSATVAPRWRSPPPPPPRHLVLFPNMLNMVGGPYVPPTACSDCSTECQCGAHKFPRPFSAAGLSGRGGDGRAATLPPPPSPPRGGECPP